MNRKSAKFGDTYKTHYARGGKTITELVMYVAPHEEFNASWRGVIVSSDDPDYEPTDFTDHWGWDQTYKAMRR